MVYSILSKVNILYINGHPNPESFNAAIANAYVSSVDVTKHKITLLNLHELNFDPVLRYGYAKRMKEELAITESQDLVQWADHLVFAYPMWWGMMPSLMSGWIARVFTPGVTYQQNGPAGIPEQLLKGKTADIIITSRAPRFVSWIVNNNTQPLTRNLFFYTGIKKKKVLVYDWAHLKLDTEARRRKFLQKITLYAGRL